jgi:protein SCO1
VLAGCSRAARWTSADLGGAVVIPPIPKPGFTFTDTRGRPCDFRRETAGTVTLLYFGFTHCQDVCPEQMSHVARALRALSPAVARQIRVVFVTIDSTRDSLPRMRRWLDHFDSSFVGLTADLPRVNAVLAALRILPQAARIPSDSGYDMGHSALVLAYSRDDTAHVAFPPSTTAAGWKDDLTRLVTIGPPPDTLGPGPLPSGPATN